GRAAGVALFQNWPSPDPSPKTPILSILQGADVIEMLRRPGATDPAFRWVSAPLGYASGTDLAPHRGAQVSGTQIRYRIYEMVY
ncbi:MAG: hypothetical protein AB1664_03555, partial [Thermodesulfobacteriota bacterium]